MYYRKRILTAFLEECTFDMTDRSNLHIAVFLFTRKQKKPAYEFIPIEKGPFSLQLEADLRSFSEEPEVENMITTLKARDRELMANFKSTHGQKLEDELLKEVFQNHPFYGIRSSLSEKSLEKGQFQKIQEKIPQATEKHLFTIGYEGIPLETYLNKLLSKNIKALVDVRKDPFSRKFGFSKKKLEEGCALLNIDYIHLPELGIPKEKRRGVKSAIDREALLDEHEEEMKHNDGIDQVRKQLDKYHRIALTCYEKDKDECHRSRVAKLLSKKVPDLSVQHL